MNNTYNNKMTSSVEVCVVKRCLVQSMSGKLSECQQKAFIDYVDECTDLASRMVRRASLGFLYYVIRRQELNLSIPDFKQATDTYFLDWMRFGLLEFGALDKFPKLVPRAKLVAENKDVAIFEGDGCSETDRIIFADVVKLLGNTLGPEKRTIPKYFDRIVGHAAVQFSTAVENCLTVNFFAKLKRVCGYEVAEHKNITGYELLVATCKGTVDGLPENLQSFAKSIRAALGLKDADKTVIYEDTTFDVPERFAVHWFLQQRLEHFGKRKLMLSPVFKVQRQHVRLDATHLSLIANDILYNTEKEKLTAPEPCSKCPTRKTHLDKTAFSEAKAAWAKEKADYERRLTAYKDAKADLGPSPLSKIIKSKPEDPEKQLASRIAIPVVKRPKTVGKDDPRWTNEIRPQMMQARDDAKKEQANARASLEFKEALDKYTTYEDELHEFALSLFNNFQDRNPKLGWKPSGSVMTDGVSLCVTYERTVYRVNKTSKEESDEFVLKKQAKRKRAKEAVDLEPYDSYDVNANTCVGNALVLGVDPGRVSLVTIFCIDSKNKKKTWVLSRGQYLHDSGILEQNRLQSERYEPLQSDFASLTKYGGALRASSTEEVKKYVLEYKKFENKWYSEFALKRRESRSKMQRYIGKQKTLASFFSKVRKDAETIMKKGHMKRIEVAYGAAGATMRSSGKGEMAVPTKGTYGACVRAFTKERNGDNNTKNVVSLENEDFTSKMSWYTGKAYERVYKKYDSAGKEFLFHTTAKSSPLVGKNEDVDAVLKKIAEMKAKAKIRKGGVGALAPLAPTETTNARKTHHISVRGLLFCPEKRMYFDRDQSSARAIAGLRCIKLSGLGRPSTFRRKDTTRELVQLFDGSPMNSTQIE